MSLSVLDMLKIIDDCKISKDAKIFSMISGGFLYSPHPLECACVAIKQTEVLTCRIFPDTLDKEKKQEIVLIVEAFEDFDYYNCLTVKELREFLESIPNKDILIGICSPKDIESGSISDVLKAKPASKKPFYPNLQMRCLFGDNIFHLFI